MKNNELTLNIFKGFFKSQLKFKNEVVLETALTLHETFVQVFPDELHSAFTNLMYYKFEKLMKTIVVWVSNFTFKGFPVLLKFKQLIMKKIGVKIFIINLVNLSD